VKLTSAIVSGRLARVRAHTAAAGVDALVVTHLPNLQYLAGFSGSAGAAILTPRACLLVVDFRYVTAATSLAATLDGLVRVETVDRSYDEAIVELLRREGPARVGIEGAYLSVSAARRLALDGEACRQPIRFAGPVLVHLAVPEALEPPRGSWTQVSGGVPAVDDHASAGVQGGRHARSLRADALDQLLPARRGQRSNRRPTQCEA